MKDLLLIDDDVELLDSLSRLLAPLLTPLSLCTATRAPQALELLRTECPKVVLLDLCLDARGGVQSGLSLLAEIGALSPATRVIILTGHGSVSHGVEALRRGASSFVEKPADPAHLAALITDAARQAELRLELERLRSRPDTLLCSQLRGQGRAAQKLREQITFIASTSLSALLLGETGTGKGLIARMIHSGSTSRTGNFVHYQPNYCGGDLMQSELCGHVKGAFTGADTARRGLVQEAHNGTLFIDELDGVPPETQIRFLDVIQERRVRAIGSNSFQSVDVRWIAATNRPLAETLENGAIRRDLYHRLAQCTVEIPPLRDRREDIPDICTGLLAALQAEAGLNIFEIAPPVLAVLQSHSWPGNVRQLNAVITTAAYRARFRNSEQITEQDLDLGLCAAQATPAAPTSHKRPAVTYSAPIGTTLKDAVDGYKAKLLQDAFERHEGSLARVVRELNVDPKTVRAVLQRRRYS